MKDKILSFYEARPAINRNVFARECGCSRQMLNYILNDKVKASDDLAKRIVLAMRKYGYRTRFAKLRKPKP
jgi:DNA-binding LacI/PurR family transcriptional regulator